MASRYELEVTVAAANDLKNVNWRHGALRPYAVVWIDPANKSSTHADDSGDTSPRWDQTLLIPFSSPIEDSTLFIDIVHAGADEGTKPLIGSARLPLRDVIDDVGFGGRFGKKLDLKRPSGRPQGKVEVQVAVREPRYREPEPYSAHPYGVPPPGTRDFPAPGGHGGYGAPSSGYQGYGQPAAYGQGGNGQPAAYGEGSYGQPAASGQGGYGQPAAYGEGSYGQPAASGQGGGYYGQAPEEKKTSKFGGMGTGLAVGAVAGAIGGIALVEGYDALKDNIADDAAERVEADLDDEGSEDGGDDDE